MSAFEASDSVEGAAERGEELTLDEALDGAFDRALNEAFDGALVVLTEGALEEPLRLRLSVTGRGVTGDESARFMCSGG